MNNSTVLGIESSCDDTSAAVLHGGCILSNIVSSQIADHAPYGGVVPEIASRKHLENIIHVLGMALSDAGISEPSREIDLIAVTKGPGLVGSLLVGIMAAKGLALAWNKPIIGVNHLEGHIFSNILSHKELEPPFISLIVSGGHTDLFVVRRFGKYELLGQTRDDAAGEAFDKVAKMLSLGYPGGPIIDKLADEGEPNAYNLPLPLMGERDTLDFSYSGLKSAVWRLLKDNVDIDVKGLAASFRRAVVETLIFRIKQAVTVTGINRVAVAGGVSANRGLRAALLGLAESGVQTYVPMLSLCSDNAAMIAIAGLEAYNRGIVDDLGLSPVPSLHLI